MGFLFVISEKFKISNWNRVPGGLLNASWVSDLEKSTSQISLEKVILSSFVEKILVWKAWGALKSLDIRTFRRRDG